MTGRHRVLFMRDYARSIPGMPNDRAGAAIDYESLIALDIPDVDDAYTEKDAMLYALGLGLGQDPMNEDELAFVYEKNLKALPTFAVVLGYPPYWLRDARAA